MTLGIKEVKSPLESQVLIPTTRLPEHPVIPGRQRVPREVRDPANLFDGAEGHVRGGTTFSAPEFSASGHPSQAATRKV